MQKLSGPGAKSTTIACFISPHGFGHAARAAAVIEALHRKMANVRIDIYTSVPQWFFDQSLTGAFTYNYLVTDIGLVQRTPLQEDLDKTLEKLDAMLPFENSVVLCLAEQLRRNHCRLVLCDIAPLGIAVARAAGIASVLIENFTWDWIYQGYTAQDNRFIPHISYLKQVFTDADHHVQTEPVCRPVNAGLTTHPVGRTPRKPARQIRRDLNIPLGAPLVTLTLGGIPPAFALFESLPVSRDYYVIIPGGAQTFQAKDNIRLLPHHSGFYHPDLIHASDAVIAKLGYSTLAEVYHAGIPFGYIPRTGFRESAVMEIYVKAHVSSLALTEDALKDGQWMYRIPQLLAMPKVLRGGMNGAEQAADYISRVLN